MALRTTRAAAVALITFFFIGGAQADTITNLKRMRTVSPIYPKDARLQHIEGWVEVIVTISPAGNVVDAVVRNSSPAGIFDEAAVTAFRQWQYEPTGLAESVKTTVRLKFTQQGASAPVAKPASPQPASRPAPTRPPDLSGQITSAQAAVEKSRDKVQKCRNTTQLVDQACTMQTRNPTVGAAGCAVQQTLYNSMGCDPASIEVEQAEARKQLRDLQNKQREQQQNYQAPLRVASAPPPPAPVASAYSAGAGAGRANPVSASTSATSGCPKDVSYLIPTLSPRFTSIPGVLDSLRQPLDHVAPDRATLEKMLVALMLQRDASKETAENGNQCAQQLDTNGSLDDTWVDYSREPQGGRELCFHQMRLGQDAVRVTDAMIKALECRRSMF